VISARAAAAQAGAISGRLPYIILLLIRLWNLALSNSVVSDRKSRLPEKYVANDFRKDAHFQSASNGQHIFDQAEKTDNEAWTPAAKPVDKGG